MMPGPESLFLRQLLTHSLRNTGRDLDMSANDMDRLEDPAGTKDRKLIKLAAKGLRQNLRVYESHFTATSYMTQTK